MNSLLSSRPCYLMGGPINFLCLSNPLTVSMALRRQPAGSVYLASDLILILYCIENTHSSNSDCCPFILFALFFSADFEVTSS